MAKSPTPRASSHEITSLDELIQKSALPVKVHWPPGRDRSQQIAIIGRRLRPCEDDEVRRLLESVLPPLLPPEKPGDEQREDLRNQDYQNRLRETNREARAYALYCAFPIVHEGVRKILSLSGDKQPERKQLVEAIQGLSLDNELLAAMYFAATAALISDREGLKELVDFI